jgi:serine/threonine protein kinase
VTLCDFNIAEKREGGRIFDAQGTVVFSPPEVFGRVDPQIGVDGFQRDMWSMGVLAYCLITGETPVQESDSSLMTQIEIVRLRSESGPLQLPSYVQNHRLRYLVESLLDPDPERRMTVERCEQQLEFV